MKHVTSCKWENLFGVTVGVVNLAKPFSFQHMSYLLVYLFYPQSHLVNLE